MNCIMGEYMKIPKILSRIKTTAKNDTVKENTQLKDNDVKSVKTKTDVKTSKDINLSDTEKNVTAEATPKKDMRIKLPSKRINKALIIINASIFVAILAFWIFLLVKPYDKQIYTLDFTNQTCEDRITLLPDLYKTTGEDVLIYFTETSKLFDQFDLYSRVVCFAPKKLLSENANYSSKVSFINDTLFSQEIKFETKGYATVTNSRFDSSDGVNANEVLKFNFDKIDSSFAYTLTIQDKSTDCIKDGLTLNCDLKSFELNQGTKYLLKIERHYGETIIGTVFEKELTTIPPVVIVQSSIKIDETVINSPTEISIKTNKPIAEIKDVKFYKNSNDVTVDFPYDLTFNGDSINVKFNEGILRKVNYELVIPQIIAQDGGTLESDFKLKFTTSGGPKATGINTNGVGIPLNQDLAITFDHPLNPNQNYANSISLSTGSAFTTQTNDKTVTINPSTDFPLCTTITVTINNNVQNLYGILGDSNQTYTFKSQCAQVQAIGTSVGGRQILAYTFGTGSRKILYIGSIHGNEGNTKTLLTKFIADIEANIGNIPAGTSITIIPALSPDGIITGSRYNNNGVDLNRNFATANWAQITTDPKTGLPNANGGGVTPASEPETQAIVNYINANNPVRILSYHSQGGSVLSNDAGDARALTSMYSQRTGYKYYDGDSVDPAFTYAITGSLEIWTKEKLGIPTVVVELGSATADQFETNKGAMWEVMK